MKNHLDDETIIEQFIHSIVDDMKEIDPDFSNLIDEKFWDLVDD